MIKFNSINVKKLLNNINTSHDKQSKKIQTKSKKIESKPKPKKVESKTKKVQSKTKKVQSKSPKKKELITVVNLKNIKLTSSNNTKSVPTKSVPKHSITLAKYITNIVYKSGTQQKDYTYKPRNKSIIPHGYGGAVPKYMEVKHNVRTFLESQTNDRTIFFDILVSEVTYEKYNELVWERNYERFKYLIRFNMVQNTKNELKLEKTNLLQHRQQLNDYITYIYQNKRQILYNISKSIIRLLAIKSFHTANNLINIPNNNRPHKIIWLHCMLGNIAEYLFSVDSGIVSDNYKGARYYDFKDKFDNTYEIKFINSKKIIADNVIINHTSSGTKKIYAEKWKYLIIYTETNKGISYYGYLSIKDYQSFFILNNNKISIPKKYIINKPLTFIL